MFSEAMPVVQKYGGTSVGSVDKIKRIAERVVRLSREGQRIAVVVSAMSGETNRLVDLMRQINPQPVARNYDMAVAAGEQVSVALMASAIESLGFGAHAWLAYQLGIYTDRSHARARIQSIDQTKIYQSWAEGKIPVIAGFQGVTREMEITTLGRGGSDTSAVALAVAIGAQYCEINTDVDGVFTADPRVVHTARRAEELDFEVALEMASLGSKVLHSRCVELGAKYKMPIFVRDSFNPDESIGTKIMNFDERQRIEAPVVSGVTLDRNVIKVTIDHLPKSPVMLSHIFEALADSGVNVDVIVHNRVAAEDRLGIGFTIGIEDKQKLLSSLEQLKGDSLLGRFQVSCREGLAKVSVVGLGMISHPGVASTVFTTLSREEIEIVMISTSEIKISCVIDAERADKAAQALHKVFIESDIV